MRASNHSDELYRIVYVSRATVLMAEADLDDLLAVARDNNARLDVTGMLLYKDQSFLQVLEGRRNELGQLFNTIKQDDRHCRVRMLAFDAIEQRDFPGWSMGFQRLSDGSALPEGYSDFMNPGFETLASTPRDAYRLLLAFRENS